MRGFMPRLTEKQRRFVHEYLVDLNATDAARRAGYSDGNIGRQLITKDNVRALIEELKAERAERTSVTADRVLKEIARVAFTDMRSYAEWGPEGVMLKPSEELSEDDSAAVTEVSESFGENGRTLKFKLAHKDSALKMLAQHVGLFDRSGDDGAEALRELGRVLAESRERVARDGV